MSIAQSELRIRDKVIAKHEETINLLNHKLESTPKSPESISPTVALQAQEPKPSEKITSIHVSEVIKDHPEYLQIYEHELRINVMRDYGAFLQSLNLPNEKIERLKRLLVEERVVQNDVTSAAADTGIMRGSREFQKAVAGSTQEIQREMADILGAQEYSELKQATKLPRFEQQISEQIAPALVDAGIGLSPETSRALAKIMASNNPNGATGFYTPDPSTQLSPADSQLLSKASAILTPAQLKAVKVLGIENNKRQTILSKYFPPGGTYMVIP